MSTRVEWADEVWNATLGCSKVSPGCDNSADEAARRVTSGVMASNESARTAVVIEAREGGSAPAVTGDLGVRLVDPAEVGPGAVFGAMRTLRQDLAGMVAVLLRDVEPCEPRPA